MPSSFCPLSFCQHFLIFCAVRWVKILVPIVLLVLLAFVLLKPPSKTDAKPPRFEPMRSQPSDPFTSVHYGWGNPVPFQNGQVWLWTISRTNFHNYLYDLDKKRVVGELLNGAPVFGNNDQSKLLCETGGGPQRSLYGRFRTWINDVSKGKIPFKPNNLEVFWVLNLQDNSAKCIGELSQIAGSGSHWVPSPGFRYSWNVPSNNKREAFLCDLESGTMRRIKPKGHPRVWWDDRTILVEQSINNFGLFDVKTEKTTPLFTTSAIAQFLHEAGLTNKPIDLRPVSNWNGHDYDIYFTERTTYGESFLLKAERPGPKLTLLYRTFKREHLGRLNSSATHYLYAGESGPPGRGGNGGVFLRDLSNNSVRTVVEPDHRGQYSLPRFYNNEVIYFRNRLLWRVDLNGSNNAPLFPD